MTGSFNYRPKFVDIRVKKPAPEAPTRAPDDRACDHIGCEFPGEHRAPKAPNRPREHWYFCRAHAAEYNRNWNYFDGMTEDEFVNFQAAEAVGHRPMWTFRPARGERVSASRFWRTAGPGDTFGLFRNKDGNKPASAQVRSRNRVQIAALEALSLPDDADATAIRTRYAELVKRWHPDSNGGDRSSEGLLTKAVQAYQTLKRAGLA